MTSTAEHAHDLADVLGTAAVIVTCGPGGVGKTTTAAALGLAAARAGRRVVVVTVDPARRLADALDLDDAAHADEPHHVTAATGPDEPGELWALMLDDKATFDRLVREQAGSDRQAQAILDNRAYRTIAGSLSGAQEYMAIERVHQLDTSADFDLVIVDTPPSRHAVDLLEAPDRLVAFLSHPVYRTLTIGHRALMRVTDAAASMFLWTVKRLAGPRAVEETIELFRLLANIEPGLRQRAGDVADLLRSDTTSFVVVCSPRSEAIDEAEHLVDALHERGFPLDGIVINLIHPLPDPLGPDDAKALGGIDSGPLADHLEWHAELRRLAAAERLELHALVEMADDATVVEIPLLDDDVHDLDGLAAITGPLAGSQPT